MALGADARSESRWDAAEGGGDGRGSPAAGPPAAEAPAGTVRPAPHRDPLTGAYSRASFHDRLRDEVERAIRHAQPCSLLVIDLDHFKSVNDAFGHARGDEVLAEFARRANSLCRSSDLLFRYGGDEFVMLLPQSDRPAATVLARRLLTNVCAEPFGTQPPLSLSLSIGVATCPDDAATPERLFEAADARSYEAKRRGRSQVISDVLAVRADSLFAESPRLLDRDDAIHAAHAVLGGARAHGHGALVVRGRSGSGRTRLLHEVVAAARLRGFTVCSLTPAGEDRRVPYAALRRVLAAEALTGAPPEGAAVAEWGRWLRRTLATEAGQALFIAVDPWADLDRSSRAVLMSLLTDAAAGPVALGLATDPEESPLAGLPVDSAAHPERYQAVDLVPFSSVTTRVWLRGVLQWEMAEPAVEWLHHACAGLPGLLWRALPILVEHGILTRTGGGWTVRPDFAGFPLRHRLGLEAEPPPDNLPELLMRFVGREHDLAELRARLQTERLVTLVGPGGIGKTRLSLEAAHALRGRFEDGIFFVPLSAVTEPRLVLPAIAAQFGITDDGGRPLPDRLQDYLRHKHLLLVLDNLEQVIACGADLAALLAAAPHLTMLATSRERLHVYGEHLYPIEALAVPDAAATHSPESLALCASVELFVDRARAARPQFSLTPENAPAVAAICRELDGLPLAIELAAARAHLLSPQAMLPRLQQRLKLLDHGPRNLPARQQTLRNAILWSYDLLEPSDQILFRRLGVFLGDFSLDDADAVIGAADPELWPGPGHAAGSPAAAGEDYAGDVLEGLGSLVEKSLLRQTDDADGEPRFSMLATIREFALDRLAHHRETDAVSDRHATYYLRLGGEWQPHLRGAQQGEWLLRYERAHPNFLSALRWLRATAGGEAAGLRLAASLWWFWRVRGHMTEGRRQIESLLAVVPDSGPNAELCARAHNALGTLARDQGDYPTAVEHFETSLVLAEQTRLPWDLARANEGLGWVMLALGRYDEARDRFERCRELRLNMHDRWGIASALEGLGDTYRQWGNAARAMALWQEGLAIRRELGDVRGVAQMLNNLGVASVGLGDYAGSVPFFRESLDLRRRLGDQRGVGATLNNLGSVLHTAGDTTTARLMLNESLLIRRDLGDRHGIGQALSNLGYLALNTGSLDEAVALMTEARQVLTAMGHRASQANVLQNLARARTEQGQPEAAMPLLLEALAHRRALGNRALLASCLAAIGVAALGLGQSEPAARLFGGVAELLEQERGALWPKEQRLFAEAIATARHQLGEAAFAAAWEAGRVSDLDQVVQIAEALLPAPTQLPPNAPSAGAAG